MASRKVCIVTGELEGPHYNGGVGTANRALAIVLRELGYDVDILYTQVDKGEPRCIRGVFADHVAAFANLGIRLIYIDNQSDRHAWQEMSFLALQHLLKHRYCFVFFDEMFGTAYYPLLARKTGNAQLQDTIMCVTTNGAMEWIADINRQAIMNFESLPLMEMERRSVELADCVKTPSAYILDKYRKYGWKIAPNFTVLPNFVSSKMATTHKPVWRPINEIVFFGRLERRKGLRMFCRALDRIKFDLKDHLVTFLGKSQNEFPELLPQKAATWPFRVRLLADFDQAQALSYLKTGYRLAVMPSTEDNSPGVIVECLEENIPFLASSGSGGEELLDEESRREVLFEPTVDALSEKLLDVIASGGSMTARPSFDPKDVQRAFVEWMENALASAQNSTHATSKNPLSSKPIMIVVVPPETSVNQAVADIMRAMTAFGGNIRMEILANEPKAFEKRLAAFDRRSPVNVSDLRDFPRIVKSLGSAEPSVLGVCHISQILTPEWFERAQKCFESAEQIVALTGMAGESTENETATKPFVSKLDQCHRIDRYLVGNAEPIFALLPSTNSGFLLLRSQLAELLAETPIVDQQYDRMIGMEALVHRMLIRLHQAGHDFELIPDMLHVPLREVPTGMLESDSYLRSLATDLYGYSRGSDQWLMSRLAIDCGLAQQRIVAGNEYREYVSAKTGLNIAPVNEETTWAQQSRDLARLAQASGQVELAVDLVSRLTFPEDKPTTHTAVERLVNAANTIRLRDLISTSHCLKVNLSHEESLRLLDDRMVQIHANGAEEGRAALLFTPIDLTRVTHFICHLTTPAGANPLRMRADLVSADRTQSYSFDKVLTANDDVTWEFEVPEKLRTECKVSLSVELADPSDRSYDGYVHMREPRFVSNAAGSAR